MDSAATVSPWQEGLCVRHAATSGRGGQARLTAGRAAPVILWRAGGTARPARLGSAGVVRRPPPVAGRFVLLEEVGRGGHGVVHRALRPAHPTARRGEGPARVRPWRPAALRARASSPGRPSPCARAAGLGGRGRCGRHRHGAGPGRLSARPARAHRPAAARRRRGPARPAPRRARRRPRPGAGARRREALQPAAPGRRTSTPSAGRLRGRHQARRPGRPARPARRRTCHRSGWPALRPTRARTCTPPVCWLVVLSPVRRRC